MTEIIRNEEMIVDGKVISDVKDVYPEVFEFLLKEGVIAEGEVTSLKNLVYSVAPDIFELRKKVCSAVQTAVNDGKIRVGNGGDKSGPCERGLVGGLEDFRSKYEYAKPYDAQSALFRDKPAEYARIGRERFEKMWRRVPINCVCEAAMCGPINLAVLDTLIADGYSFPVIDSNRSGDRWRVKHDRLGMLLFMPEGISADRLEMLRGLDRNGFLYRLLKESGRACYYDKLVRYYDYGYSMAGTCELSL